MADRRCPFCGELVPSNSITCPKCFRKIPVEPEPVRKERRENPKNEQGRRYSKKLALALTLIPGLFGILGLGLIYRNPRQKRGYLVSGGEVNTERMSKVLLDEFRSGKLGRFTLEIPEES